MRQYDLDRGINHNQTDDLKTQDANKMIMLWEQLHGSIFMTRPVMKRVNPGCDLVF